MLNLLTRIVPILREAFGSYRGERPFMVSEDQNGINLTKRWRKMEQFIKDKEELQHFVKNEITHFFERVLDFAEIAISDKNVYKAFRAKVLRLGNNAIRAANKEIDLNYAVKFIGEIDED